MRIIAALLALALALACAPPAFAQDDEERRRRQQEVEKQQELERKEFFGEPSDEWFIDYGAWIRPGWFFFEDGGDNTISRFDFDVRVWGDVRWKVHELYVRLSGIYWQYANEDGPEGDDEEFEGVRGDVVFYQLQLGEALGGPEREWDLSLRAGRQYYRLGSGLVYNNVGDGLTARGAIGPVEFELFGLRSQPHEDDIDRSRPTADSQERFFFGGRVALTAIQDHTPWIAVMIERDRRNEDLAFQNFDFDAEYYGAGIRGELFLDNLFYDVEGWIQRGERFPHLSTSSENVRAWALLVSLQYQFDVQSHPRLEAALMWASGDENRFRITNTLFGNLEGTDDEAFLGFGWIQTGYSLAPYLSNLRIFRIGGAIRPLEGVEFLEGTLDHLEVGAMFYHYRKDESDGGISDPFAGFDSASIGHEFDLYLQWAVFSDLTLSVRYGVFFPGSAYEDDGSRPFFSISTIFSF